MIVEVCANSLQSAINAESAGANRIELCSELGVGGLTPSYGLLKKVKEVIAIPVHVLIRPRSGDFSYSESEFNVMKENILLCRSMGLDGIVSGVLRPNFTLDRTRTKELVELSGAMAFTFHRAFDWVKSPISTLEQLETLGVNYLLTSGQQNSVNEGMPLLKLLHKNARTCKIMPGGGVDENNTAEFKKNGFSAIHLSGTEFHKTLPEPPKVSMNSEKFLKEDMIALTGVERVAKIMKMVK